MQWVAEHDRQLPAREVLLPPHVLVGGYQKLVAFSLGVVQQFSVAQF